ncbi:hypothetical protein [Desulfitobacterium sp.]|uniref:hypothetical protein n=1 Tax=Desulfitobacterium sp. TaxID=49981 RepID=UPI002B9B7D1E|nr:hypothetical protein [Desulfitobacterium sp.]HVJ49089.1 hypothetical protein [Desulfitobacterium sp.]
MNNDVAIIEGVYDIVLPEVPASLHRWGRIVWLQDIEVGSKGKLLYFEDGLGKRTNLSRITNIIQVSNYLEIHTQSSIYKLRLLPDESYRITHWKEGKLSHS